MSSTRREQLTILRNRLNTLGNWFYLTQLEMGGGTYYVRKEQANVSWNKRRIALRNRINRRLAA